MPQYITDKTLAARYQISRATVWRWAKEQKKNFPQPVKIMGSTRWRLSDLEQWEATNGMGV
jgi:prophage regulatory protein